MFEAEQLPTCVADLDALLTQVSANDLAHRPDEKVRGSMTSTFSAPSKRTVAVNEEMMSVGSPVTTEGVQFVNKVRQEMQMKRVGNLSRTCRLISDTVDKVDISLGQPRSNP